MSRHRTNSERTKFGRYRKSTIFQKCVKLVLKYHKFLELQVFEETKAFSDSFSDSFEVSVEFRQTSISGKRNCFVKNHKHFLNA